MKRIDKTVFISYRRTNAPWARAIEQSLTHSGFDVFLDYQGIVSGDFERTILENIRSRAHFLVLLTPSALERCDDPGDRLRREIEEALETRRNIVPLMLEGFDFNTPAIASKLTGKRAALRRYAGMSVSAEYFDAAMTKLREFLNVPLDAVLHPASGFAQQAARDQQAAAATAPVMRKAELTAQDWFEHGLNAADPDEQLRCYSEVIRLQPNVAEAYFNRGLARQNKGDLEEAVRDFGEAIRVKPGYAEAYYNRGVARYAQKDLDGAIGDYSEAIRLKPDFASAYYNRGLVRANKGDLVAALQDFGEAIRIKPDTARAYYNRGLSRKRKGDPGAAIQDFSEAIRLKPDDADAYYNRGLARQDKGDLDGAKQDFAEAARLRK
jgi:tetratricopeptide (TPR) repeat protein